MNLRCCFFYAFTLMLFAACNNHNTNINVLLDDVRRYNYAGHQDSSIYFLTEYIGQETKDTSSIIKAYIALSNTYKGIRNYDKAKSYLSYAETHLPQDILDKDAVNLLIEKALVQFDVQEYTDSKETMNRIQPFLYELDSTSQAQFIMQQGYLEYLEGNHEAALGIYKKSIEMMQDCAPRHLPMVYAKKIELYASQNKIVELEQMKDSSMHYAKKYQLPIYELYTMETYRDALLKLKLFEAAMEAKNEARLMGEKINYEAKINQIAETEIENKIRIIEKGQKDFKILVILLVVMLSLLSVILYQFIKNFKNQKQIESQKEQLEKLNQVKDKVFAIIGHDLRKPVVAFRNVAKKVNYLIEKKDYARIQQLGQAIEKDSIGLNVLTDNLLNWALREKKYFLSERN